MDVKYLFSVKHTIYIIHYYMIGVDLYYEYNPRNVHFYYKRIIRGKLKNFDILQSPNKPVKEESLFDNINYKFYDNTKYDISFEKSLTTILMSKLLLSI